MRIFSLDDNGLASLVVYDHPDERAKLDDKPLTEASEWWEKEAFLRTLGLARSRLASAQTDIRLIEEWLQQQAEAIRICEEYQAQLEARRR